MTEPGPGSSPDIPELVVPGPHERVQQRLTELASLLGDQVALESADGRLTFADLDTRARALAEELRAAGGEGGTPDRSPIGILAEQCADSVVAMYGIMETGRPHVVLDVLLPEARVAQIVECAGIRTILADDDRQKVAATLPGVREVRSLVPGGDTPVPAPEEKSMLDSPASLAFTSGTTGAPKGVVYTHRTVLAIGYTGRVALGTRPGERVALVLPQAFAAGQIVATGALLNGATLCIRDPRVGGIDDLAAWVDAARVTVLVATPSLARSLVGGLPDGAVLGPVRLLVTCGEQLFGADITAFRPHLRPDTVVMNWLGSSETEALTCYPVGSGDPVPDGVVPAGRVLPLRELQLLGPEGRTVPPGEPGILHVVSAHMSTGYWADPAGTARVFEQLPDGRTRFRSGDRGSLGTDGILRLHGRADDAVKVRGYLVEPAEVEAALRGLPDVLDAVVRGRPGAAGDNRLVAWVVPDPGKPRPTPVALRKAIGGLLPDYMVPRDVVLLDDVPRNERGKVAVSALPEPQLRSEPVPPATPTEAALERIWSTLLQLDHIGRDESFTALGGDSLAVEEMLAAVEDQFGASATAGDVVAHATLAEFAALVDTRQAGRRRQGTPVVSLRPASAGVPVFCFPAIGATASSLRALADLLDGDHPVYAFDGTGPAAPGLGMERAARRCTATIEELVGEGAVALVGHGLGGLLALRVGHILQAGGHQVVLLTLIDTPVPAAGPARPRLAALRAGLSRGAGRTGSGPRPSRRTGGPRGVYRALSGLYGEGVARFHRPDPWYGRALVLLPHDGPHDVADYEALVQGQHEIHRLAADGAGALAAAPAREVASRVSEVLAAAERD